MEMKNKKFAVFILTYGRADKVITYKVLRDHGYTGKIYLICSTDDKQLDKYKELYGDDVIVFDKNSYKGTFDIGDNSYKDNVVVFARNANIDIAKKLGLDYYLQLDDDYIDFLYKIPKDGKLYGRKVIDLNRMFDTFIEFLKKSNAHSVAFAQGGDYIGGFGNDIFHSIFRKRKLMNCFFNSVKKPYKFYGRINEDVNCYIQNGKLGYLFFTHPAISINQHETQTNSGGLSEFYLDSGTYVKSFYTILFNPSAVKIRLMGNTNKRLHHSVSWKNAIPMIISEEYKK